MIITLCGSTKFKDEFLTVQKELTLQGHIILSVGLFGHADNVELSIEDKIKLDNLHKQKINMSDAIFVINKDGYIGESTYSEIDWAKRMNKQVYFLEPEEEKNSEVEE
jgi:hypothetical protein